MKWKFWEKEPPPVKVTLWIGAGCVNSDCVLKRFKGLLKTLNFEIEVKRDDSFEGYSLVTQPHWPTLEITLHNHIQSFEVDCARFG